LDKIFLTVLHNSFLQRARFHSVKNTSNEKVLYVFFFDLEERGCRVEEEEGKREDVEPLGDANGQVEHQVACVGNSVNQGFGSGSGSSWIRINLSCWILLDPDPHSNCGSGSESRRAKIIHKNRKSIEFSCFEVLDVLF
jgi:hypothetical protein